LIAAAQQLREAIRASWFEDEARLMVAFGAWPQNVDRARRFLDAVAAWDRLTGSHDAADVAPERSR
jgi:hypothetical protein